MKCPYSSQMNCENIKQIRHSCQIDKLKSEPCRKVLYGLFLYAGILIMKKTFAIFSLFVNMLNNDNRIT